MNRSNSQAFFVGPSLGLLFALMSTLLGWGSPGSNFSQAAIVFLFVAPAIVLSVMGSSHLLPFILSTWCFAPEIRRLIDWSGDTYTSVTLISIVPLLTTVALIIPVARNFGRLRGRLKRFLFLFALGIFYGLAVGVAKHGVASPLVEFAGWFLPLLVLPYMATRTENWGERIGWIKAFALLGFVVGIYAWVQFIMAPPWDMDWLVDSGMTSSMGRPEALSFRAFGTLNATGPAGLFFAFLIGSIWTIQQMRNSIGVFIALLSLSVLAITEVRTGWMMAGTFIACGMFLSEGGPLWKKIMILIVTATLFALLAGHMPGAEQVQGRLSSFGDLQNDESMGARTNLLSELISQVAHDPIGAGFGAVAEGKVSGSTQQVTGIDNGYGAIFVNFGWIGGLLVTAALVVLGRLIFEKSSNEIRQLSSARLFSLFRPLAFCSLMAMLVGNLAGSMFTGVAAFVGWTLCGLIFSLKPEPARGKVAIRIRPKFQLAPAS